MMNKRNNSDQMFQRALKVVPGGIYGHVAPAAGLPRHFPHFAKGLRVAGLRTWMGTNG